MNEPTQLELTTLLNAAGCAASCFSSHPAWRRERDDLKSETLFVVACTLDRISRGRKIADPARYEYVYRSSIRACDKYLKRSQRRPKVKDVEYDVHAVDTQRDANLFVGKTLRPEDARRHREFVEELLACCDDNLDRRIIRLQAEHEGEPLSQDAVAESLGLAQSTVSRRCKGIARRFWKRNS